MKKLLAMLLSAAMITMLAGCGGGHGESSQAGHADHDHGTAYKDGTYTGKSGPDERGAVGEITVTIEKGRITKADYKGIQKDGKVKDAEYGMTNGKVENQDYYNKAQLAVKANADYAARLVETQRIDKIDAVSGATVSYEQFSEAAKKALAQAK